MKKIIKNRFLHYSNLSKILVLAILLYSCMGKKDPKIEKKTEYELLTDYFLKEHNKKIDSKIKKIYVLTENGCTGCNINFGKIIENKLSDSNSMFLITAKGSVVDISAFETAKDNICINQYIEKKKYPLFQTSKVFFLSNTKIDTIIEIKAKGLEEQFEYILKN